jgi:ribosomal protein L23
MNLIAPIKSEKAIQRIEADNALVFKVLLKSTKPEIKSEVEQVFEVKVKSVRTYTTPKGEKYAIVKMTKDYKADDVSAKMKMIA